MYVFYKLVFSNFASVKLPQSDSLITSYTSGMYREPVSLLMYSIWNWIWSHFPLLEQRSIIYLWLSVNLKDYAVVTAVM